MLHSIPLQLITAIIAEVAVTGLPARVYLRLGLFRNEARWRARSCIIILVLIRGPMIKDLVVTFPEIWAYLIRWTRLPSAVSRCRLSVLPIDLRRGRTGIFIHDQRCISLQSYPSVPIVTVAIRLLLLSVAMVHRWAVGCVLWGRGRLCSMMFVAWSIWLRLHSLWCGDISDFGAVLRLVEDVRRSANIRATTWGRMLRTGAMHAWIIVLHVSISNLF